MISQLRVVIGYGDLHIKNVSIYRPYVWRPIAINQKQKKKKKKIIKNNEKKHKIKVFLFKIKNRVQKTKIKDVYWAVTAKMTTSTYEHEVPNVTESWSYQYW